ncbi:beta-ketoacyl-ACP synthase III [Alicyclobacillus sendaiensis]|uniref:Beta-ketoacyl-[acyl-carrier-protein] synthase III n=1 Tax=Alicyclobacillus sendaiensis PA2 TaxID=3029425 RepID=A0ABT6Y0V2_ALISE|nr:beta-ketoacyl-ACP synthase III [Alicyclobacillus sendaiensis]MDI9260524.1 beta-ketoacyl-ACP synthase III [Alicyclobacillus sendaiensis PA2]
MYRAVIRGVGSYLPETRLTNVEIEQMVETSDEWIQTRTGIAERRIAGPDEATSDFAYFAAKAALDDAGLSPEDVDLIIVATETPDYLLPPVACQVQARLGCRNIGAFDLHATCAGFLSALQVAEQFVKSGVHEHVLIVGADTLSRFTDYTDRGTCILFADGAGAFVVSRGEEQSGEGVIATTIHADGTYFHNLYIPGGGSRTPYGEGAKAKIVMDGRKIFKLAVNVMASTVEELLQKTGRQKDEIDWLIPHQANQRIIDAVAESLDFPPEKVVSTIQNIGNNSSATIPIAVDTAIRDGRIQRGDLLMLVAFGGGLVWGGAMVEY